MGLLEVLTATDGHDFASTPHRLLGASPDGETPRLDYSIMSVVILMAVLVLVVEAIRHKLDQLSTGNPFFNTVLETLYHELTTLGIVEFCLYLMHKYWESFDYKLEKTFVDVHFMLFYTALFNAIQSCLVRLFAGRLIDRTWIQTEEIEVGHYVAIRKEFDRIEQQMNSMDGKYDNDLDGKYDDSSTDSASDGSYLAMLQSAMKELSMFVRHPRLSKRRKELLVPIRFHELRAHFIDSNKLPPMFKVSHYLVRSLNSVLLDFVHVSPTAWIALMATANVIYFLGGVLLATTKSERAVNWFLVNIYFAKLGVFLLIAFILHKKINKVFSKILHMKLTSDNETDREAWRGFTVLSSPKTNQIDQLQLFWGQNPRLVIVCFQYMQFGYAFGLAFIFIYFQELSSREYPIHPGWLLILLLMSYLVFLRLLSIIIPRFTLCTSLGQLVNKERLNETLAKLKLSEELRKMETYAEMKQVEEEIERRKQKVEVKQREGQTTVSTVSEIGTKSQTLSLSLSGSKGESQHYDDTRRSHHGQGSLSGVQLMSSNLEATLHSEVSLSSYDSFLRFLGDTTEEGQNEDATTPSKKIPENRQTTVHPLQAKQNSGRQDPRGRRRRMTTQCAPLSSSFKSLRRIPMGDVDTSITLASLTQIPSEDLPEVLGPTVFRSQKVEDWALNNSPGREDSCCETGKTQSQGVAAMRLDTRRGHHGQESLSGVQLMSSNLQGMIHSEGSLSASNSGQLLHDVTEELEFAGQIEDATTPSKKISEDRQTTVHPLQAHHNSRRQDPRGRRRRMTTQCEGAPLSSSFKITRAPLSSPFKSSRRISMDDVDTSITLASLTQIPSKDLPEVLGPTVFRSQKVEEWALNNSPGREDSCRETKKTQSQGVAAMRSETMRQTMKTNSRAMEELPLKMSTTTKPTQDLPKLPHQPGMGLQAKKAPTGPKKIDPPQSPKDKYTDVEQKTMVDLVPLDTTMEEYDSKTYFIDSDSSMDGDSDLDDVPDALCTLDPTLQERQHYLQSLNERLAIFFLSKSYQMLSFLFGPMVCFLIVAMRVEAFNIASGTMEPLPNTWNFSLDQSFWIELVWYCMMLAEMLVVILTFLVRQGQDGLIYSSLAAGWGCLINLICLLLLIVAEMERCCDGGSYRLLAAESYPVESTFYPTEICSCLGFGLRTYGGLGKIEPFTCLIALSQIRFLVATIVIRIAGKSHADNLHSQNHSHGHGLDLTKMRDIWTVAIGKHSQIARTRGLFSHEVLLCMLGIYSEKNEKDDLHSSLPSNLIDSQRQEISGNVGPPDHFESCFDQFAYPLAKLIRHMRRCEIKLLPMVNEWTLVDIVLTNHELILFDVDMETDHTLNHSSALNTRHAGKGLSLYDVAKGRKVVSQFALDEIDFVYIEHRPALQIGNESDVEGRGHSMFDVAMATGRAIVRTFTLDELDSVDVDQVQEYESDVEDVNENFFSEFWQGSTTTLQDYNVGDMNRRWNNVDEDRLKIRFKHSTLFIRFWADLKEKDLQGTNPLDTNLLNHVGNQIMMWCKSIARLRGATNLYQKLPHFGEGNSAEIEDFIVQIERSVPRLAATKKRVQESMDTTMHNVSRLTGMAPAITRQEQVDNSVTRLAASRRKFREGLGRGSSGLGTTLHNVNRLSGLTPANIRPCASVDALS